MMKFGEHDFSGATYCLRAAPDFRNGQEPGISRVRSGERGFSLFELLIAMFMMVLVSVMLYSILNAGISFSAKGEARLVSGARQRAFLELLHRQVHGAWYSSTEHKLKISVEKDKLRLITTSPLLNRDVNVVMAFYYYDRRDRAVYYAERIDFYNPEYFDDFEPDGEEMVVLLEDEPDFVIDYDEKEGLVKVGYGGRQYDFAPRCWREEDGER